jgi:hypothetical protein
MKSQHYFGVRPGLLLILGLVFCLMQVSFVGAAGRDNLRWTVGCNGFTSNGGGIVLNRDNTGQGREVFVITATDGAGNVIFGPVSESSFVGSSVYIAQGVTFNWSSAPAINPILVSVVSPAGNGWAEQVVYSVLGTCLNLGTIIPEGVGIVGVPDGTTSPSVLLNADPPRPTNPQGLGHLYEGYLIVDTGSLNLRSGDGPQYTIVGRVRGGTELIVLGRNNDRSWWYVQVGEIRGWVNGELVIIRGDLTHVPVVPVVGEIFPPRLFVFRANPIYLAANERSGVYCIIDGDLEYRIIAKNRDGSWFLIEAVCNDVTVEGWILAEFGAIRNSGDLPVPILR